DFGPVPLWTRAERTVVLVNEGTASQRVDAIRRDPACSAAFSYDFTPLRVEPGARVELRIAFEPEQVGPAQCQLTLLASGGEAAPLSLRLIGAGVDIGDCSLTPSQSLDFGTTPVGEPVALEVEISNPSSIAWKVTLGALEGDDADAFTYGPGF